MIKNIDKISKLLLNSINMLNDSLYPSIFSLICKSVNTKTIGGSKQIQKFSLKKYI